MFNVIANICNEEGCVKSSNFALEGGKACYCSKHKKEDMINVRDRKCKEKGCRRLPIYGTIQGKYLYCSDHKKEGMTNVKNKKCKFVGCNIYPVYGTEWGKTIYCSNHKEKGMTNVKSKRCKFEGCEQRPVFGIKKYKPLFCKAHKENHMENVIARHCQYNGCKKQPNFGYKGQQPTSCAYHKEDKMSDIVHSRCFSCDLFHVRRKKGLCSYCKPNSTLRRKTREMELKEYLEENCSHEFIHNKSVGYVCGNFRPDFLFDANTHFIVIECDEDQHRQYTKECEKNRMLNIYQSLGLPTIFLRYNPDKFKINNKRVVVHKKQRMKELVGMLEEYFLTPPSVSSSCYKFYYDTEKDIIQNWNLNSI